MARTVTLVALTLVFLSSVAGLLDGARHAERFRAEAPDAWALIPLRFAVASLGAVALVAFLVRLRRSGRRVLSEVRTWLWVRALVYAVFAGVLAATIAQALGVPDDRPMIARSLFRSALIGTLGVWAIAALVRPGLSLSDLPHALRVADVVLMNVVVVLVLAEACLALWARHSTSPLFFDDRRLGNLRPPPNSRFFDFTMNSGGYLDDEFFRATEDDLVVAVLADSFGLGVVPYRFNFATVAEERLRESLGDGYGRVAVFNFGMPGVGMPEYLHLIDAEVARVDPALVALCVFAGNDVVDVRSAGRRSLRDWWIWKVTRRLLAVRGQTRAGAGVLAVGTPTDSTPEWIADPEREPPTFSEETFLEIETRRVRVLDTRDGGVERHYRRFFEILERIHERLGDRLCVVVIPDELQVNDALYREVVGAAEDPARYERDYPQKRISSFCAERRIPVLDLLPALRSAELQGRTYHLRDTHWNARGNRVAGENIAEFLESLVD